MRSRGLSGFLGDRQERKLLEIVRKQGSVVGVRLLGEEFLGDTDSGEMIVPKKFLICFRLSGIPEELVIKPVEAIEGNVIQMENDIAIGPFRDGSAWATVEDMGRRKLWDGEVGFGKFMEAMRQAVRERQASIGDVAESDFQDDGDYVFIWYEVQISEDMAIEAAVEHVERIVTKLEKRRDQILSRRIDPLLGIYDKGTFNIDLAHALEVAQYTARDLALILVDIDHFKMINDSFGHQIGDVVLQGVAQALAAQTRGKGEAYRWGGEELAALLAGAKGPEAVSVAEEIRRTVEQSNFAEGLPVTVSCGVACFPTDGNTAAALVKAADDALLRAKSAGRNMVKIAQN